MLVVLGGDGSILRAARQMGDRQLPVLGVNLGRLGFLADIAPDELDEALAKVASGAHRVVRHLMFLCQVERAGVVLAEQLGLNEAAILTGVPFTMLEAHLYVDADWVTTYSCDGLIVSTPVGSTAHSLSAGGPILRKDLQAFVISPISPHTLTNRPVVDSADRTYDLVVPKPNPGTALVVDGRVLVGLEPGDRVRIRRAAPQFQLIEVPGHGYYRTLREKLGWGGGLVR
jgi:NAD+ kinase